MIKWMKPLIEKVFGKFCKCEEPIVLEKKPEGVVLDETNECESCQ